MKKINIAIDGYSGTGKSSTAKKVAARLGYIYIDSGAMYRATTLYFIENGIDCQDIEKVNEALKFLRLSFTEEGICINERLVANEIRTMAVNHQVSHVAAVKEVRTEMVKQQQIIGVDKGVVMDGRDIGTVVFPDAELKVFMIANADIRAKRRQEELAADGVEEELSIIKSNLLERDKIDSTRETSPLMKATDAVEVDTSNLTLENQINQIIDLAQLRINES